MLDAILEPFFAIIIDTIKFILELLVNIFVWIVLYIVEMFIAVIQWRKPRKVQKPVIFKKKKKEQLEKNNVE